MCTTSVLYHFSWKCMYINAMFYYLENQQREPGEDDDANLPALLPLFLRDATVKGVLVVW